MINIRHTGIYVKNIEREANFYKNCFSMIFICEKYHDSGEIYNQLLIKSGGGG